MTRKTDLTKKEKEQLKAVINEMERNLPKRKPDIIQRALGYIIGMTVPLFLLAMFVAGILFFGRYIFGV